MAAAADQLADLLTGAEERPHFQLSHRADLPLAPPEAYAVTDSVRLDEIAIVRWLFRLRGIFRPGTTRETMNGLGFETQRDEPGKEISFLGAGRLCGRRRLYDPVGPDELARSRHLAVPARSIAIWAAYRFEPIGPGRTLLTHATRVRCASRAAWLLFGIYWIATRPFLDLIRFLLLRAIRRRCAG